MKTFFSRGKLLITAEYLVLDGALALAVPVKFGQSLIVQPQKESMLLWKSLDETGKIWFEGAFVSNTKTIEALQNNEVSNRLTDILNAAKILNPNFLNNSKGFDITTQLEFSRSWGLGSSSTLINNIAQWAHVDAYQLLKLTFGGSGYDIACAQNNSAITYQLQGNKRHVDKVDFNPEFRDQLFFIHLNKKQDSRKGIATYNERKKNIKSELSAISKITSQFLKCSDLDEFELLISDHEKIISNTIKAKPIKELLFKDYQGAIKSLGAWGGDFVLVTGNQEDMTYFKNKGFSTIIRFTDMLL